jgi:hypothetical protein
MTQTDSQEWESDFWRSVWTQEPNESGQNASLLQEEHGNQAIRENIHLRRAFCFAAAFSVQWLRRIGLFVSPASKLKRVDGRTNNDARGIGLCA